MHVVGRMFCQWQLLILCQRKMLFSIVSEMVVSMHFFSLQPKSLLFILLLLEDTLQLLTDGLQNCVIPNITYC